MATRYSTTSRVLGDIGALAVVLHFPSRQRFQADVGFDVSQGASGGRLGWRCSARWLTQRTTEKMKMAPQTNWSGGISGSGAYDTRTPTDTSAKRRLMTSAGSR